jgi:RimJ/RimL family protein N-acetyltransferase
VAEFRLETDRLILREWRDEDVAPFAAMCADERVMATLGAVKTKDETVELISKVQGFQERDGHTAWALVRKADKRFVGWCGLIIGYDGLPIEGLPEIGWRLAFEHWGKGYAKESALAAMQWGFEQRNMDRIWAITSKQNPRSFGLMERLGMSRHVDLDFDHPHVPDDSPLRPHVTYSMARDVWIKSR